MEGKKTVVMYVVLSLLTIINPPLSIEYSSASGGLQCMPFVLGFSYNVSFPDPIL